MNLRIPIPSEVETVAAVITKSRTFGDFAFVPEIKDNQVETRVMPPMQISMMPIIKMVRKAITW